jgi:lipopolysaccharide/colanic/teichoic acid biosynthesis glycosyltransferase
MEGTKSKTVSFTQGIEGGSIVDNLIATKLLMEPKTRPSYVVPENPIINCLRYKYIKRSLDVVGSGIGLILLSPFLLFVSILIKLTSPGPVLYAWNVIGRGGRPFRGYKFRTMVVNADELKKNLIEKNEMSGPVFKMKNDPRIIPIGHFLRKFSIDEFPQLWSVLKGDMSLVGPRPAGPNEWEKYEPWQRRKLSVTPGITCLWQVNGRNLIDNFNEWVRLDLEYIDTWSLGLDVKILWRTARTVLKCTGV